MSKLPFTSFVVSNPFLLRKNTGSHHKTVEKNGYTLWVHPFFSGAPYGSLSGTQKIPYEIREVISRVILFITLNKMPKYTKQDIEYFKTLYLEHYGKVITDEDAEIKIDALVDLIRLAIEYKVLKSKKENENYGIM